jgi:hypothetical protein
MLPADGDCKVKRYTRQNEVAELGNRVRRSARKLEPVVCSNRA